jgi:hypothetical protein
MTVLSWCVVASAWLSMAPYFIWGQREPALLAAAVCVGAVGLLAWYAQEWQLPNRRDLLTGGGLALFLTYITAQPTVAGGHAMWVFVLPTLFAVLILPSVVRVTTYRRFELAFLLSLIPGLLYSVAMIAGVDVTFTSRAAPNAQFAAAGIRMLQGAGAVFIESNSQVLPWGGFISRLCGMYDEPGMVGTIAALMLAARAFDVRGPRAVLLWLAGTLSLSLAFVVITLAGLAVRTLATGQRTPVLWGVPVLAAGLFTLGILRPPAPDAAPVSHVRVEKAPGVVERASGTGVRQTQDINNRSRPEMDALVDKYLAASWKTVIFGVASDASVVYGGASSVWTRVLTNHGVVGLVLLTVVFAGYAASSLRRSGPGLAPLLFFGAFALSFYQRPVIWLPYTLLVFFGASAVLESSAISAATTPRRNPASS